MIPQSQPDLTGPRRAVVIGASIAGLLAARVLSEHFDEVVVVERDALPADAALRKGTPQAAHAHGLLARGLQILEEMFPGYGASLQKQGAEFCDIGNRVTLRANGQAFAHLRVGVKAVCASRPLLEAELRRRVRALPNVYWREQSDVLEPRFESRKGRVTGLLLQDRTTAGARQYYLAASLVVDCSGRASRSPQWLHDWGYAAPAEERVTVNVAYTTAHFRREPNPKISAAHISNATPALPRPGVVLAQEADGDGPARWVVTMGGYGKDTALPTPEGLRQRARETGCPAMIALTEHGVQLGDVRRYNFPHSRRRRFERLNRFPAGFLVLGDAIASFNPIYGQGMAVAACEAQALRALLAVTGPGVDVPWHAYFRAVARVVDAPWQMAVGADLALPMVTGARPLRVRLINAYMARVFRAATRDADVASAFVHVMHLLAPPASLFAPGMLWRVWRAGAAPATRPGAAAIKVPASVR